MNRAVVATLSAFVFTASVAGAAPLQDWTRTETRADCASLNPLRAPFFGELHIHTGHSLDAAFVRVRTTPRDAYEFAKGAVIGLPPYEGDTPTRSAQIRRPLDFTAVTDHSENFGESVICFTPGLDGYDSSQCQGLRDQLATAPSGPQFPPPSIFTQFLLLQQSPDPTRFDWCGAGGVNCLAQGSLLWQDIVDAAEEHYDRTDACTFTTFVGYEWTANTNGWNLHRNVIFRNDDVPAMPTSYFEAPKVQQLWDSLVQDCSTDLDRCEFLTVPHNPNASGGLMFVAQDADGLQLDRAGAEQRSRYEPLVEIFQNKGGSECRTGLGTNDEACGFEQLQRAKLFVPTTDPNVQLNELTQVRNVLKSALSQQNFSGGNPFRVGFVGSTDGHNSTPGYTNEEDVSETGTNGAVESQPEWRITELPPMGITANPGGLAVLWAEENSRDALFAAMKRREAYATSGTRPIVRFFAGDYPTDLCSNPAFVETGYDQGVPMGGQLGAVRGKESPRFAVMAEKDPGGNGAPSTPLQRIQIVKGWLDKDGRHEAVYDVAGDADNGASVDLATCTPTGDGFDSLCTVWEDPDFDPAEHAFYYARVLQNPTCRWQMYVCNQLGVDCDNPATITTDTENCCLDYVEKTVQERAWTSPVWYRPDFVGVVKGKIKFGKNANEDKLKLGVEYPKMNRAVDPSSDDVVIVLRDNDEILNVTIPAASFETKKAGKKWQYEDKAGTIGGIKQIKISVSGSGKGKLKLTTVKTDLSAADANNHDIELSVSIGDLSSTVTRAWEGDAKKLGTVKL